MRMKLIVTPLLLCASPALAQQPPQVPPRIADPAVADRLANAAQAVSNALLDIPVGDLKAAAEGRRATPDEKSMTVRDLARRDDPDFDRKLQRQIARFGRSAAGMPPPWVYEASDGVLVLYNGVTRATRIAKLSPGTLIRVEVVGKLRRACAGFAKIGDVLP